MRRLLPFLAARGAAIMRCGTAAAQGDRAPPGDASRASYTRIYCTPDAETHFETVTVDLARTGGALPPFLPIYLGGPQPASRATFAGFEPRWGAGNLADRVWHPAPVAQTVVMLRGTFSVTTTDGETRRFGAGDVIRAEDTAPCKGHITVAGDEPVLVMFIR
jgi:hypothetical protein